MREVKRLVAEGVAGRLVSIRAQFGQYLPDWHPWEDYRRGYSARRDMGGGVVLDRVHELDYVRWLMGNVTEVCALSGKLSSLEIDSEDTAEILLRFESGAFGSVHLDYVRRDRDCRLEIVGEEGTLEWSYQRHARVLVSGRRRAAARISRGRIMTRMTCTWTRCGTFWRSLKGGSGRPKMSARRGLCFKSL